MLERETPASFIVTSSLLVAITLITINPITAVTATQSDHPYAGEGTNEGNVTILLSNYDTGKTGVDIEMIGVYGDGFRNHVHEWGFEYLDTFGAEAPHGPSLTTCTPDDLSAAGLDRDNDEEGTNTDVGLLPYNKGHWLNEESFGANMYNGSEIASSDEEYNGGPGSGTGAGRHDGDPNLEVYPDDRLYLKLTDCVHNPDQEGWYQWTVKINGTTWDGYNEGQELTQAESHRGEYVEVTLNTNWIPVCSGCENRSDAREAIGPPPSEDDSNSMSSSPTPTSSNSTPRSSTTTSTAETHEPTPTTTDKVASTPTPSLEDTDVGESNASPTIGEDDTTPTSGTGAGFGVFSLLFVIIIYLNYRIIE